MFRSKYQSKANTSLMRSSIKGRKKKRGKEEAKGGKRKEERGREKKKIKERRKKIKRGGKAKR